MQPIPCSELRIVVFDAHNPLDLADEANLWLKGEGETMEASIGLTVWESITTRKRNSAPFIVWLCAVAKSR